MKPFGSSPTHSSPLERGHPLEVDPPKLFEAVPSAGRDMLGMKEDQRKKLDEIDKELNAKLEKILTAEQNKSFAEPNPSDSLI